MNKGVYFGLGLIVGLGVGACAVLVVKNRERIRREEEVQSVKDAYREHFHSVKDKEFKQSIDTQRFEGKEKAEALRESNRHVDYNKYATLIRDDPEVLVTGNQYEPLKPVEPDDDEEPPFDSEEDHPPEDPPQEPYVITPEEYAGEPQYSKEDLMYYTLSDTLVDDHDVEVDDIDRLIGGNNLRHMGEIEPGCLWIRNPAVMTDYQIVGIKGYWEG